MNTEEIFKDEIMDMLADINVLIFYSVEKAL
jgi:hypothetical protein